LQEEKTEINGRRLRPSIFDSNERAFLFMAIEISYLDALGVNSRKGV